MVEERADGDAVGDKLPESEEFQDIFSFENFPLIDRSKILPELAEHVDGPERKKRQGRPRSDSVNVATPMMWDKPAPALPFQYGIDWPGRPSLEPFIPPHTESDKEEREIFADMLRIRRQTSFPPTAIPLNERRHRELGPIILDTQESHRVRGNPPHNYQTLGAQARHTPPIPPSFREREEKTLDECKEQYQAYIKAHTQMYQQNGSQSTNSRPTQPSGSNSSYALIGRQEQHIPGTSSSFLSNPANNQFSLQAQYGIPRVETLEEFALRAYKVRITTLQEKRFESERTMNPRPWYNPLEAEYPFNPHEYYR